MAYLRLFLFRNSGAFVCTERLPRNLNLWEGRINRLASCFELNYFNEALPVVATQVAMQVKNNGALLRQPAALAAIKDRVRSLRFGQELWLGCTARNEAGWTTWNTCLLCPDAAQRAVQCTPEACWRELSEQVAWSRDAGCRMFVGPEYFFHKGTLSSPQPYTPEEVDALHVSLARLTDHDDMFLLIPGTVFWTGRDGVTHNSLLAYAGSQSLCSGETFYDKQNWTGDELKSAFMTLCGPKPYVLLTWHTLRICIQICQDSAFPFPGECDIHIVVGHNTNLTNPKNRAGGIYAYADAMGMGRTEDPYGAYRAGSGISLHQRDLAWTPRAAH